MKIQQPPSARKVVRMKVVRVFRAITNGTSLDTNTDKIGPDSCLGVNFRTSWSTLEELGLVCEQSQFAGVPKRLQPTWHHHLLPWNLHLLLKGMRIKVPLKVQRGMQG